MDEVGTRTPHLHSLKKIGTFQVSKPTNDDFPENIGRKIIAAPVRLDTAA